MTNIAIGRTETAILTNKSGGALAQGDVVIVDTANAAAVTTTTSSAYVSGRIGVVIEPNGIANNANGLIAFSGYVSTINLSGTGSIGDLVKTHTVAKQGVRHAAPQVAGDFAQALGTSATPAALLFGTVQLGGGGSSTSLVSDKKTLTSGDKTTTSTTFVDVDGTNMSITLTTGARRCLVTVLGNGVHSNTGHWGLDIDIDGARQGQTWGLLFGGDIGSQNDPRSFSYVTDVLSAGSHTFKLQWRVDSGTATLYASTTTPLIFSVVELPLKDPT